MECRGHSLHPVVWSPTILGRWLYFLLGSDFNLQSVTVMFFRQHHSLMVVPPPLLFHSETEDGVMHEILHSDLDLEREPWPKVSDSAKDLLRCMLDRNPKTRLTAKQVLGMLILFTYGLI